MQITITFNGSELTNYFKKLPPINTVNLNRTSAAKPSKDHDEKESTLPESIDVTPVHDNDSLLTSGFRRSKADHSRTTVCVSPHKMTHAAKRRLYGSNCENMIDVLVEHHKWQHNY